MPTGFPIVMCGYITRCELQKSHFQSDIDLSVKPVDICCHSQGLADATRLSAVITWKTAKNVLTSLHCQKESKRKCDEKRKKVRERERKVKKARESVMKRERKQERHGETETASEGERDSERGEERYRNLRENDKNKQTETRERDRVVEEMGR